MVSNEKQGVQLDPNTRLAKLKGENQRLKQKQAALEWNNDLMTSLLVDDRMTDR